MDIYIHKDAHTSLGNHLLDVVLFDVFVSDDVVLFGLTTLNNQFAFSP